MSLVRGNDNETQMSKIEVIDAEQTLGVITKAEIDMQITTAKQYPRNRELAIKEAIQMATFDQETAEACIYAIPRGGKTIKGPSIRLAEIMAYCWGNLHSGTRIVGMDNEFVTAQAVVWDLEKNCKSTKETKRSIKDRSGRTYNTDMKQVTSNAAMSIALRDAILRLIPGNLWKLVYDASAKAAIGDVKSLVSKGQKLLERLQKMGLMPDKVLAHLGISKADEMTADQIETLIGIGTALKEGQVTVENALTGEIDLPGDSDALNKEIFK